MARRTSKSALAPPLAAPDADSTMPGPSSPAVLTWKPLARAAASVLLVVHLAGVFAAPLNERPSSSVLAQSIVTGLRPYLDAAYLNHGYGFFSPDPGSSIIIRYALTMPGGETTSGVLPDLGTHWPRLRYHRHFMLTSQAPMFGLPIETNAAGQQLPQAYARHLKQTTGAQSVRLEFVEHRPTSTEEIAAGRTLANADTYRTLAEVTLDEHDVVSVRQLTDEPLPEQGEPPSFGPVPTLLGPLRPRPSGDDRPPYGPFPNRSFAPEEIR